MIINFINIVCPVIIFMCALFVSALTQKRIDLCNQRILDLQEQLILYAERQLSLAELYQKQREEIIKLKGQKL